MISQVSCVRLRDEIPCVEGWSFEDRVEVLGKECPVIIVEAERSKCPRCWTYSTQVEGEVCERCSKVLSSQQGQNVRL
jgi:hypothetical protein